MQHVLPQFQKAQSRIASERRSSCLQRHPINPLAKEFDYRESERVFAEASVTTVCGNGRDIAIDGVPGIGSLCNPRAISIYAPDTPPYSATDTFHLLIADSTGLRVASRSVLRTLKTLTNKNSVASISIAGVVQVPLGVVFTDDIHHKIKLLRPLPSNKMLDPYDSLLDKTFYTEQRKDKRSTDVTHSLITLSGSVAGHADGLITKALFNRPTGLASACSGRIILICDTGNNCIRCLDIQNHFVTTLVGTPGKSKSEYMTKRQSNPLDPFVREAIPIDKATLRRPMGICISSTKPGVVYITDTGNHTVKRIDTINQLVQNIAGLEGQAGSSLGYESMLNTPIGICELPDRTLLVSDKVGLHRICPDRCFLWQVSSTRKGTGWRDGPLAKALFSSPNGLGFDGEHVFVCDIGNQNIRMITFGATTAHDGASALNAALSEHQEGNAMNQGAPKQERDGRATPIDRTEDYGKHISYQNGAQDYDDNDTVEIHGNKASYSKEKAIPSSVKFTTADSIRHVRERRRSGTPDYGYYRHMHREERQRLQLESSDSTEMIEKVVVTPMEGSHGKTSNLSPKTLDARAQSLQARTGYNFKTVRRTDSSDVNVSEARAGDPDPLLKESDVPNLTKIEVHRGTTASFHNAIIEPHPQVEKVIDTTKAIGAGTAAVEQTVFTRTRKPAGHDEISISSTRINHASDTVVEQFKVEPYTNSRASGEHLIAHAHDAAPQHFQQHEHLTEAEDEYTLYKSLSSTVSIGTRSINDCSFPSRNIDTPMVTLGRLDRRAKSSAAKQPLHFNDPMSPETSDELRDGSSKIGHRKAKPESHREYLAGSMESESSRSGSDGRRFKLESTKRRSSSWGSPHKYKEALDLQVSSSSSKRFTNPPRNINDLLLSKYQEKHKSFFAALVRCSHSHASMVFSHVPRRNGEITALDFYSMVISRCIAAKFLLLMVKVVDGDQLCTAGFDSLGRQALSLNDFGKCSGMHSRGKTSKSASLSMGATAIFSVYGDSTDLSIKSIIVSGVKTKITTKMGKSLDFSLIQFPDLIDRTIWRSSAQLSQIIDNAEIDEEENKENITLVCLIEITFSYQQIRSTATVDLLLTNEKLTLRHTTDECTHQLCGFLHTQALYPVQM
ncbi:Hypothetical protein GLP15_2653 [Giardia lamblia P15]|uniref:NHL repeat protein n=1 Tax=Giardia intestinalis (strain P15) TaxID=658858 RepID=E1F4B5_GIAIA|nr:Hypothetical protein GLP15_2653 [Giardia lamblia P15]